MQSNRLKLKGTSLDLGETVFGKCHLNRFSGFAIRLWTDRHTHGETDTKSETLQVFFPETITIHLVNIITECEKYS